MRIVSYDIHKHWRVLAPNLLMPCPAETRSLCPRLRDELAAGLPTATRSTDLDSSFRLFGQANQTLTRSDNDLLSHVTRQLFFFMTLTKERREKKVVL